MYQDLRPFKLETERLIIRPVEEKDAEDFYIFTSDKRVVKYLTFKPFINIKQVKSMIVRMEQAFFVGSDLNMSIILKNTNKVIGSISLSFKQTDNNAEVGYLLNYDYWNQHYASEALDKIISFAFDELKVSKLKASYILENTASGVVLKNKGFKVKEIVHNGFSKGLSKFDLVKCELVK